MAVPYYRNRTLQDTLPAEAVSTLTGFLPRSPREGQDLFAPSALREFVTQNVLSLITIMWEYDESALRKGMWRMPHVVRSVVKQQSIHKALEQHQELLRDIVVRHALVTAARQGLNTKRDRLITMLTDLRDVSPFRDVREVLEHEDLVLLEPSHIKEKRAQALLRLIGGYCGSGDRDRFLLVRRSALRSLDSADASSYENEIHRIFPELQPTDWRRG